MITMYWRRRKNVMKRPSVFDPGYLTLPSVPVDDEVDLDLAALFDDEDADDLTEEDFFGVLDGTITGLRYYEGLLSRGETVVLVREPTNKYDKNAVRVENMFGAQVGHLKKELAACLAPILDAKLVKIEGIVPCNKNVFSMPVTLYFHGKPENRSAVNKMLSSHDFLLTNERKENLEGSGGVLNFQQPLSKVLADAEFSKGLGKMFENLRETDKTEEREPANSVKTSLFPHQKKALAWMYRRENDNELPPFWEKGKNRRYVNTLTNTVTAEKPDPIRGGILADDMGLGKTLQMISLIVTSYQDGKPLPICPEKISSPNLNVAFEKSLKKKKFSENLNTKEKGKFQSEIKERSSVSTVVNDRPCLPARKINKLNQIIQDYKLRFETEGNSSASSFSDKPGPSNYNATSKQSNLKKLSLSFFDLDSDENEENKNSSIPSAPKRQRIDSDSNDNGDIIEETLVRKENKLPTEEEKTNDNDCIWLSDEDEIPMMEEETVYEKPVRITEEDLANVSKTASFYPRATLIVCPLSVMAVWNEQIREHLKGNALISIHQYYGQTKNISAAELKRQDIVLTTYSTLAAAHKRGRDLLFQIDWFRIVLDEAHAIRNPDSLQSKACCSLRAERRWVLTGTPIQNRLLDLYSLIKFLRVQPLDERKFWRALVERHVNKKTEDGLNRIRCLMQHLAMRREKTQMVDGKPLVALPDKTINLESLEFSEDERTLYDAMHKEGKLIVNKYIREGTLLHHYAHVLAILMRLRQLCCHPFLVKKAAEKAKKLGLAIELLDEHAAGKEVDKEAQERLVTLLRNVLNSGSDEECSICLDSLKDPVITPCAHVFCRYCVTETLRRAPGGNNGKCPMCRGNITLDGLVAIPPDENIEEEKFEDEDWQSSAKVDALMSHLSHIRIEDEKTKSVVISQFTSFLNVIEIPLKRENFRFARLDGTMNEKERRLAIKNFSSNSEDAPTVFLLSMKAGGVGINLTAATRVFLMDPAWNPAIEEQCFDRCHRLGQTKPVVITKFVVKNSVEERMLELQERKRQLMQEAFSAAKRNNVDNRQQRINDIKLLMR